MKLCKLWKYTCKVSRKWKR